ncbi:MAG: helix-turn-helix domain-containing protein [Planctomycetes bacterium]|nr:helix-turn-helix domain-containing protein [Planctomycetota bacterium]
MVRKHKFAEIDQSAMGSLSAYMKKMALEGNIRARTRAQAVYFSYKYLTVAQIAQQMNRSPNTVYMWLRKYREKGLAGIMDKTPPTKLAPAQVDEMMKASGWDKAHKDGRTYQRAWPLRKIAQWIKDRWNIKLSHEGVRKILKRTK